jgi:hypothetical protein
MLIFQGGSELGKTGEPGETPSWQGREPTNNSTHMKYPSRGSNPLPTAGTTVVRGERITATPPMPPIKHKLLFILSDFRDFKTSPELQFVK